MASEASFDLTLTKMKRLAIAVVVALMGVVAMPTSASAQFDLSKIFGGSSETTKTSPYKVLADNAPAKSEVVGTWKYNSIDLEYLGTNSFAEAAIAQVEDYARQELVASGLTPGCFTITLQNSGKGSFCYQDYTFNGSYTYDTSNARFELSATADNGKVIKCGGFLKKVNGKLVVMFNAEDALKAFAIIIPEVAADAATYETIYTVAENFPGIYISLYFNK